MINLDELTVGQLKEINLLLNKKEAVEFCPWKIGKHYFIRTVTMYLVGKLTNVTSKELVLVDASWVCDTGRFHDALKNGTLNEVEPFLDDVILNRECIIDATVWNHVLPNEQK